MGFDDCHEADLNALPQSEIAGFERQLLYEDNLHLIHKMKDKSNKRKTFPVQGKE